MSEAYTQQLTTLGSALLTIVALILGNLLVAFIVSRLSRGLARGVLRLTRLAPGRSRPTPQRRRTLEGLLGSLITAVVFIATVIGTLSLFVKPETLIWIIGLFSAAFGLGARALVSNFLAGSSFIFRNTFAVGEKVEMPIGMTLVEGIIEEVNLTTTAVRAPSGELYVAPNGEIMVIRNFSRGAYSAAKLKLNVPAGQLAAALALLEPLGSEAMQLYPDLVEPWQVISTTENLGKTAEVTLLCHVAFGKAAALRLRLFDLVYQRLNAAGVVIGD